MKWMKHMWLFISRSNARGLAIGSRRARRRNALLVGLLVWIGFSQAAPAESPSTKTETLDNGVKVLLGQIPGAEYVAVETLYPVGIYHDPKGMPQATHVLERLICESATNSYPPGGAIARITEFGLANAEAMPDVTHFDYLLPPGKLNLALKIESERLTSLSITKEMLTKVASEVYDAIDLEKTSTGGGMDRHALMAAVQGWRAGVTSISLRSGIESLSVDRLDAFRRAHFTPDQLTLVIVGKFDPKTVMDDVRRHLGAIPRGKPLASSLVNWQNVPAHRSIQWDLGVAAVALSFPPPTDPVDRAILNIWGLTAIERARENYELRGAIDSLLISSPLRVAGVMPFTVYATVNKASALPAARQVLTKYFGDLIRTPVSDEDAARLQVIANQYSRVQLFPWDQIEQRGKMRAQMYRIDEARGTQIVLGDLAHAWGYKVASGMSNMADKMAAAQPDVNRINEVLQLYLDPSNARVTELVPK